MPPLPDLAKKDLSPVLHSPFFRTAGWGRPRGATQWKEPGARVTVEHIVPHALSTATHPGNKNDNHTPHGLSLKSSQCVCISIRMCTWVS